MINDKERELLLQIKDKTEKRLVNWEPSAQLDEFLATFKGEISITCRRYLTGDGDHEYAVTIRDREGRELFSEDTAGMRGFREDTTLLRSLYESAHHSGLKYEETLDSLLDDLKKAG